ncbi:hypothetical protein NDU88_004825 [Pleurodeles waltl]|uniref:Uncharacterized protein n=1 Tax=Pleurodeles waltl TaxID=8319 RepID=A0AAV7RJU3_PLEWA|nr:hypothetical protein NDU88_004825 [Pleurodeles waltl]
MRRTGKLSRKRRSFTALRLLSSKSRDTSVLRIGSVGGGVRRGRELGCLWGDLAGVGRNPSAGWHARTYLIAARTRPLPPLRCVVVGHMRGRSPTLGRRPPLSQCPCDGGSRHSSSLQKSSPGCSRTLWILGNDVGAHYIQDASPPVPKPVAKGSTFARRSSSIVARPRPRHHFLTYVIFHNIFYCFRSLDLEKSCCFPENMRGNRYP